MTLQPLIKTLLQPARFAVLLLPLFFASAHADEGMWTLDNLPLQQMKQQYGFVPSAKWQDLAMHAAVRVAQGCSGSFVSGDGLVMTNHHCAVGCLSDLTTKESDLGVNGFIAKREDEEVRCPNIELNQLETISDVTDRVQAATNGKSGADLIAAKKQISSVIEKECAAGDPQFSRCDVVTLYQGGRYAVYKYRRYQDVRLVFSPEEDIADFGGDPDNFNFPRFGLDCTFLRAYVDGKPAHTAFFKFAKDGPKAGDMTFVIGNPGGTEREDTVAELLMDRSNSMLPAYARASTFDGVLWQYSRESEEHARQAHADLFFGENGLKVVKGRLETLNNPQFLAAKQKRDDALRDWVMQDPERVKRFGDPWKAIADVADVDAVLTPRYTMLEAGRGFRSSLFGFARTLVRHATEQDKPDAERLPYFRDANVAAVKQRVFGYSQVYPDLEITTLALSMNQMRQTLGPDDALVHEVLGSMSEEAAATSYVNGSKLADPEVRRQLWDGGMPAILASSDSMIKLALALDPESRKIRKEYEDRVQAVISKADEAIARAKFARDGTSDYPDATFTLRVSYGRVEGWKEKGVDVAPFTTFGGLYQRATGSEPFKLPPTWVQAQSRVNPQTPFDFVTTNDIIGGNSGSPVIDRDGQVVGLIFDGNIHSLSGDYFYNPVDNRSIAVDAAAMEQAIRVVYGDRRLADELTSGAMAGH